MKNIINRLKSVASNELIYIVSDILVKAIAFISMPFFLSIMTTEDFGLFNLYTTYVSILVVFYGLNISTAIVRYYVEKEYGDKYLATAIWNIMINSLVCSVLIAGALKYTDFFVIKTEIVVVLIITTTFNCLGDVGRAVIRAEKRAKLYGASSILNSLISTGIGLFLVYSMQSNLAFWRLVSVCLGSVVIGSLLTIRIFVKDGMKWNFETTKYLLAYSIPLIPFTLSSIILAQVNKFFLADISLSEVGIYSFASNLAMIIFIITSALNNALQPNLFEALRDNTDYKMQLKRNVGIFYFFYIGFIFGSDILVWIFGNSDYTAATMVIPLLVLGYGYFFLYSLYVSFMYYFKKNSKVSFFSIISAVVAVFLNFILIQPFGYMGAALATVLSYFTLFALGYFEVTYRLKIKVFNIKEILLLQGMLIIPVATKIVIFSII